MEKNYSYVSPELDLVEVDSYVCCMGESGGSGDGGGTVNPGGDEGDLDEI